MGSWADVPTEIGSADVDEKDGRDLAENLGFWMTQLPPRLRATPIIQLAIPGSHNTMTYTIERHNEVGPDEAQVIRTFGRYLPIFAKPLIFNWSINQYERVTDQLEGGIRYLDLRVATKPSEPQNVYFLHGLYGSEIGRPLREVADWLGQHPRELLILDFQHFYGFEESSHRRLIERVRATFRGKLCPVHRRLEHVSLDWLAAERCQLIVVYRQPVAREYGDLWPTALWPTPWPNTVNVDKLLGFLDEGLRTRKPDAGFISQCLLTPNTGYVARHLCGSLHRDLSALCRGVAIPWIQRSSPGHGGLNVVISDYVAFDDYLFSKVVIRRNAALLKS